MKITFELDRETLMGVYRGYCDVSNCDGCKHYVDDFCNDKQSKEILESEIIELINERV